MKLLFFWIVTIFLPISIIASSFYVKNNTDGLIKVKYTCYDGRTNKYYLRSNFMRAWHFPKCCVTEVNVQPRDGTSIRKNYQFIPEKIFCNETFKTIVDQNPDKTISIKIEEPAPYLEAGADDEEAYSLSSNP